MKWPNTLTLIRHAESTYNMLREKKAADPLHQSFLAAFKIDHTSEQTHKLAALVRDKFALGVSDYDTPLSERGVRQAVSLGSVFFSQHKLHNRKPQPIPDVIFCSPYLRTRETLRRMSVHAIGLKKIRTVHDDRIREQEHGLSLLYNDKRLFHTFHPEQKALHELLGPYWYQYPQGESVSQVRDRIRLFMDMLIRECAGMHVLVVTHHLTILSIRANLERLSPEDFVRIDEEEKPINCGVTRYQGDPNKGINGKLNLEQYNARVGVWKVSKGFTIEQHLNGSHFIMRAVFSSTQVLIVLIRGKKH